MAEERCPKCDSRWEATGESRVCPRCAFEDAVLGGMAEPEVAPLLAEDFPSIAHGITCVGDYELLQVLGHGGMGVVYKARQRSLNRLVALKLILGGQHASAEYQRRFRQEAEATAQLRHPNIVPVYEVGIHEGQPYFSMEYVPGVTLADLVRGGPLPARAAVVHVCAVADAIHYAHQQGFLHRDLKPSNIIVGDDGRTRVTDFGLVRQMEGGSELTVSGALLGTPAYLPPEQASSRHGKLGPWTDVYSLGAVLYHLLTGNPPFAAGTVADVLRQVTESEPAAPRRAGVVLSPDLETICLKCLEKDQGRRYPTALALREDLDLYLAGRPIRARPVGPGERAWKWCRRNPVVAGLTLIAWIAVLVGYMGQRRASQSRIEMDLQLGQSLNTMQLRRAEELLQNQDVGEGLAYLAAVVRRDPENRSASTRLMNVLQEWNFPTLLQGPWTTEAGYADAWWLSDNHTLVTVDREHRLRLVDVGTGRARLGPLQLLGDLKCFQILADLQEMLILDASGRLQIWDLREGFSRLGGVFHPGAEVARVSSDRERIVTCATDGTARVWSAKDGRQLFEFMPPNASPAAGHTEPLEPGVRLAKDKEEWQRLTSMVRTQGVVRPRVPVVSYDGSRVFMGIVERNRYVPDDAARVSNLRRPTPASGEVSNTGPLLLQQIPCALILDTESGKLLTDGSVEPPRGEELFFLGGAGLANRSYESPRPLLHATFSADNQVLWTIGDGGLQSRAWDGTAGTPLSRGGNAFMRPQQGVLVENSGQGTIRFSPGRSSFEMVNSEGSTRLPTKAHVARVQSAAYSDEGLRVLSASADGLMRVWNSESADPEGPAVQFPEGVLSARFGPDSARAVVVTASGKLWVWGLPFESAIESYVFESESNVGADWNRVMRPVPFEVRVGESTAVDFSGSSFGSEFLSFPELRRVGEVVRRRSFAFSPGNRWGISVGEGSGTNIYDSEQGLVRTLGRIQRSGLLCGVGPLGGLVVLRLPDPSRPQLAVMETATGRIRFEWPDITNGLWTVQFSPDERFLALDGSHIETQLLETETGKRMWPRSEGGSTAGAREVIPRGDNANDFVEFSPRGTWLLVSGEERGVELVETVTGKVLPCPIATSARLQRCSFTPRETWAALAFNDGVVRIWNPAANQVVNESFRHEIADLEVGLDEPGSRLATLDGMHLRVWDVASGSLLLRRAIKSFRWREGDDFGAGSAGWRGRQLRHTQLRFDPGGHRLRIVQAGRCTWVDLLGAEAAAPGWLPDLAEALGGKRLTREGLIQPFDPEAFNALRFVVVNQSDTNQFLRLARWLFSDPAERVPTVLADVSRETYRRRLRQLGGRENLERAERLDPRDALTHAMNVSAQLARQPAPWGFRLDTSSPARSAERAMALAGDQAISRLSLGLLRLSEGATNQGWNHVKSALSADPTNALLWGESVRFVRERRELSLILELSHMAIEWAKTNSALRSVATVIGEELDVRMEPKAPSLEETRARIEQLRAGLSDRLIPRSQDAPATALDLSRFYNAAVGDDWHNVTDEGNNLAAFQPGMQELGGVVFDARGLVQLQSTNLSPLMPHYPWAVTNIPVDRLVSRMDFLQGTGWVEVHGRTIAHYMVHYGDDTQAEIPVRYGIDVRNWQFWPEGVATEEPGAEQVWKGPQARWASFYPDWGVRLFHQSWTNSKPGVLVRSVDWISERTGSAPFLLGISAKAPAPP